MKPKPAAETPSPRTISPTSTAWITSVFFSVIPTAKLRVWKTSITQTVARICASPPVAP